MWPWPRSGLGRPRWAESLASVAFAALGVSGPAAGCALGPREEPVLDVVGSRVGSEESRMAKLTGYVEEVCCGAPHCTEKHAVRRQRELILDAVACAGGAETSYWSFLSHRRRERHWR